LSRKEAFSRKKVFAGLEAFFVPKTSVLQKKGVFAGFGRFFVPKMAQDTSLRGGKSHPGGPKYLQEGQLPPYFPRLCFGEGSKARTCSLQKKNEK